MHLSLLRSLGLSGVVGISRTFAASPRTPFGSHDARWNRLAKFICESSRAWRTYGWARTFFASARGS